ncbi:MAG TPA: beta-ketoacyl-[acyl-carrier-protein] synthase family protein, partial [Streptosporangiaceae bacterium]
MSTRVAITGLGAKTPAGATVRESFTAVSNGKSLARRIDALCDADVTVPIAAVVPEFDRDRYFSKRERLGLDRTAQLGLAAAIDAASDSGLAMDQLGERCGVFAGIGGVATCGTAESVTTSRIRTGRRLGPFTVPMLMPSATAARIGLRLGVTGPALTYATACASGSTAIGEALRAIRSGALDAVLAGGAESGVTPLVIEGFAQIGALSRRTDDPAGASRPFDQDRDGFVMGEGAAFLVLESWDRAAARGARIYAELAGYGSNSDAYHIVAPDPGGGRAARCVAAALADARLDPADIGHVNAHGTATVRNDDAEAAALASCFGPAIPPVTATKGITGHMIGGAGAFEAVMTVLTVRHGWVPPVANFHRW